MNDATWLETQLKARLDSAGIRPALGSKYWIKDLAAIGAASDLATLLTAHKAGLLRLCRCDLVPRFAAADVQASEREASPGGPGGPTVRFHFVDLSRVAD